MMTIFEKYVYWKILKYFAMHPGSEVYVNEISEKLGISRGMCSRALRDLRAYGILKKRESGKEHFYRLEENYLTRELKRFVFLFHLYDSGFVDFILFQMPDVGYIVLYGSHARGDFNEDSDVDVLIIGPNKSKIQIPDEKIGKEVNIQLFTVGEWLRMKKENAGFYNTVKENHIVLYGGELP